MLVGLPATGGEGEQGACARRDTQFRLRVSGRAHHRESRAGGCAKEGGWFDLPIALGILLASEQFGLPAARIDGHGVEFYGELALSGELKTTRGPADRGGPCGQADHEIVHPASQHG